MNKVKYSKEYQRDDNELLRFFLEDTFFNRFLESNYTKYDGSPEYLPNMKGIELIIRPDCNQKCDYCYITKYGKSLYPEHYSNEQIIKNFKLILNYLFNEKELLIPELELFAGDLFYDNLIFELLDILYPYLEKIYQRNAKREKITTIIFPNNCSFIQDDEKTKKFQSYINKYEQIKCPINISVSIDGKYSNSVREKKQYDDIYYDKLFKFIQNNNCGMHPMISAESIESACENYDWWIENLKKYDIFAFQPMMLEVRNPDSWTDEKIQHYLKFLKHVINHRIDLCDNDIDVLTEHLFNSKGNTLANGMSCGGYDPIYIPDISNIFQPITNRLTCSFSEMLHIRVGDLNIVPCHRLCYPHFIAGNFILDDDKQKIIGVEAKNVSGYISMITVNTSLMPGCFSCPIKNHCLKGCLGAQYEWSGEYLVPILSVCKLMKAKFSFLIQSYYDLGVLQNAKKKNYLSESLLNIINSMGYNLDE